MILPEDNSLRSYPLPEELKKVIQTRIAERTTEGLFGGAEKISIQEIMDIIREEVDAVMAEKEKGGEEK